MKTKTLRLISKEMTLSPTPKVGMIVLSTDLTCERDFCNLRQHYLAQNELVFDYFVNRIEFCNPMTKASLNAMLPAISTTVEKILPGQTLDTVVFNCTSASALLGDEVISKAIHSIQPDATVITTASASVQHMISEGCKKISLLAPYTLEISLALAEYFQSKGLQIVSLSHLDIEDDGEVAQLQANQLIEAAKDAMAPDSDALFISCTATPAVDILPIIAKIISKPCFSSNHSTFVQTLRAVSISK